MPGEELQKQFRRATVTGGPLHGARYLDVGWEDLRKSAKQYKTDPRFNQFAKRCLSEKGLGEEGSSTKSTVAPSLSLKAHMLIKSVVSWIIARAKVKTGITLLILFLVFMLLSRPKFYSVLARGLVVSMKAILRRSIGLIVLLMDAILDEAAASLEASLITSPNPVRLPEYMPAQHPPAPRTIYDFFWHGLFTLLGILIGHRLPRATQTDRNAQPRHPTRLRVV